ncbi:MAG: YdbH domain-containing protein [Opitutaceae bacterium]
MALLLLALALPTVHAADWKLPAWGGELHGKLLPLGEGGPQLAWTFTPATTSTGERMLSFRVEDAATHFRATATLDAATGDGSWKIEEGRIEVGPWLAALAPGLGKDMAGLSGEGAVMITGEGLVRQGRPSGSVKISWSDGVVKHAGQGWTLEGIAIRAEIEVASLPDGAIPVALAVRTISTARFGARNLAVAAVLNGTREIAVKSAGIEIAGGTVETDPFTVPLSPPSLNVQIHMKRVGLQDVVALVPTMLSDARGRINGALGLSWSEADGLHVGKGTLDLDEIEFTSLRLAPKPGFLTARVPARFVLVPNLPKLFSNWFAPVNPAYATLTDIELGKLPLRVDSLKVRLTPDGDELGRTASVTVIAHPEQAETAKGKCPVKEVVFTINVAGPLSQVLKVGMSDRISFGAR